MQNPQLTKALFQAQIMLGMVKNAPQVCTWPALATMGNPPCLSLRSCHGEVVVCQVCLMFRLKRRRFSAYSARRNSSLPRARRRCGFHAGAQYMHCVEHCQSMRKVCECRYKHRRCSRRQRLRRTMRSPLRRCTTSLRRTTSRRPRPRRSMRPRTSSRPRASPAPPTRSRSCTRRPTTSSPPRTTCPLQRSLFRLCRMGPTLPHMVQSSPAESHRVHKPECGHTVRCMQMVRVTLMSYFHAHCCMLLQHSKDGRHIEAF